MSQQTRIRNWIKAAEVNGWRVGTIKGLKLRLACSLTGCKGHRTIDLNNPGEVPAPCDLGHVKGYSRRTFDEYTGLVAELALRRRRLGLDQIDLNDAMGMADGYISKLESFARVASTPTLQLWCETLGVRFTVTPAPLPDATRRAIEQRKDKPDDEQHAFVKGDRSEWKSTKRAMTG